VNKKIHMKMTIKDVAREAGVSIGSTSRVLNNIQGVKPKTRNAVLQAAEKLGYTPNRIARALRSQSTGQIGLQFSDLANPLQVQLYGQLEERLAEAGYVCLMSTSANQPERERSIFQTFKERGLDALIAAPVNETDAAIQDLLDDFPAPVLLIDREIDVRADNVRYNHSKAMKTAVAYLTELGHERIAPVFNSFAQRPGRMRQEAFETAARENSLSLEHCPLIQPLTPNTPVTAETIAVLSKPMRPTALVVQGTQVLHSVLNAAALLNLQIPEDLSILAVGDSNFTIGHLPPLTSITMDGTALVEAIANLVLRRISDQEAEPKTVLLEYHLVERESCSEPPKGS
jgi:LacI family transcriptional regulator, galactose operon repressor